MATKRKSDNNSGWCRIAIKKGKLVVDGCFPLRWIAVIAGIVATITGYPLITELILKLLPVK